MEKHVITLANNDKVFFEIEGKCEIKYDNGYISASFDLKAVHVRLLIRYLDIYLPEIKRYCEDDNGEDDKGEDDNNALKIEDFDIPLEGSSNFQIVYDNDYPLFVYDNEESWISIHLEYHHLEAIRDCLKAGLPGMEKFERRWADSRLRNECPNAKFIKDLNRKEFTKE